MSPDCRDIEILVAGEPLLPACEVPWWTQVTTSNLKVPKLRLQSCLEEWQPPVGCGCNKGIEESQRHGGRSMRWNSTWNRVWCSDLDHFGRKGERSGNPREMDRTCMVNFCPAPTKVFCSSRQQRKAEC